MRQERAAAYDLMEPTVDLQRLNLFLTYALSIAFAMAWSMVTPLIPLYISTQGGSARMIGLVVSASGILPLVLAMQAGALVDTCGPELVARGSALVYLVGSIVLAAGTSIGAVTLAFALMGLGNTGLIVSTQTIVAVASHPTERVKAYGYYTFWNLAGMVIAPVVGGIVVDRSGYQAAFFIVLALAVVTLGFTASLKTMRAGSIGVGAAWRVHGATRMILARPGVSRILVVSFLIVGGQSLKQAFYPIYLQQLGFSTTLIGLVVGADSLASMAVRPLIVRGVSSLGYSSLLLISMGVATVALGITPFVHTFLPLMLASALMGVSTGFAQPLTMSLMSGAVAADLRGLALGVRLATQRLANVISPIAFGAVMAKVGIGPGFLLGAVVLAAALPVISHLTPRSSRRDGVGSP